MQGHIRKRGKGSWTVVIDLGRDPATGRRRQLWQSIKGTKREAQSLLVQLLHQRNTGIEALPGKITVGEYLHRWLQDYARPNTAPKTYRCYDDVIRRHLIPVLGTMPLTKLRPQHIQAYYSRALQSGRLDGRGGLSARSVLRQHQVLHTALRHAVRWQLLARNPADAVEPPKPERLELAAPGPKEIRRLLSAAAATPYGVLVHLAVMTGLRRGEILGLRWQDVDLDAGVLRVQQTVQWLPRQGFIFRQPKTGKSRRAVALSPDTVRSLRQHRSQRLKGSLTPTHIRQDDGLVFTTPLGTPINPSNLRRTWLRIVNRAGLNHLRFHDLRHAHASLMLQQGIHPKVVSERLGHSGVGITLDIYSHVLPGLQAEAAAQLDRLFGTAPSPTSQQDVSKC
jgi:integrase